MTDNTIETTGKSIQNEVRLMFDVFKKEHPDFHIPYYTFFCVENCKGNNKMFFASNVQDMCRPCFLGASKVMFKDQEITKVVTDEFSRLDNLDGEIGNLFVTQLKPLLIEISEIFEKSKTDPRNAILVCNILSEGLLYGFDDKVRREEIRVLTQNMSRLLIDERSWIKQGEKN